MVSVNNLLLYTYVVQCTYCAIKSGVYRLQANMKKLIILLTFAVNIFLLVKGN